MFEAISMGYTERYYVDFGSTHLEVLVKPNSDLNFFNAYCLYENEFVNVHGHAAFEITKMPHDD